MAVTFIFSINCVAFIAKGPVFNQLFLSKRLYTRKEARIITTYKCKYPKIRTQYIIFISLLLKNLIV